MRCLFRRLRTCGSGRRSANSSNSSSGTNSSSNSTTGISSGNVGVGGIVGIGGRHENGMIVDKRMGDQSAFHGMPNVITKNAKLSEANQKYLSIYGGGGGVGGGGGGNGLNISSQQLYYYHRHSGSVPISICIMIIICYMTLGAVLFHRIQNWSVLESLYFCFTSLGTIGFGDISPKGNVAQYAASAYILIGMAVVAMCFSLIQSELVLWLRKFGVQDQQSTNGGGSAGSVGGGGGGGSNAGGVGNSSTNGNGANGGNSNGGYNHLMHPSHHNHLMHQLPASSAVEDVALVTVAVTPKSWLRQPDFLGNDGLGSTSTFNSLPRRSQAFQRNTPARRSAGPLESHIEYFVPRSVSEFNLAGVGDIALPPQRRSPPILSHSRATGTIMIPIQQQQQQIHHHVQTKPREKMVTFEDDAKCPHGMPTTPRKIGGDVFMWREGGWNEPKTTMSTNTAATVPQHQQQQYPGEVIKV